MLTDEWLTITAFCDRRRESLQRAQNLGFAIALDNIGTAYSSLANLRDLPIDMIKLDQSFARSLNEHPENLQFALSLLSLARGLGKRMVVEGVETADIQDALRVLGVDYGQGYAVARPMTPEALGPWISGRGVRNRGRRPRSMLGAYAGHLLVVETCRNLMNQPLQITWKEEAKDPHACAIGQYFDHNGLHETTCGHAHKRFHEVLDRYESDRPTWETAARGFHDELIAAIRKLGVKDACPG